MFNLKITNFKEVNPSIFQEEVKKLAEHIVNGKGLEHKVSDCCLRAIDEKRNNAPSLEVLEDLRAILLTAQEKGLGGCLSEELSVIRNLADEIIMANPIGEDNTIVQDLEGEMISEIFSKLHPSEISRLSSVSRKWNDFAPYAQIKAINELELPLHEALTLWTSTGHIGLVKDTKEAKEHLQWLFKNPCCNYLTYADFDQLYNFNNDLLEELAEHCPNLQHIRLKTCVIDDGISGDGLKVLEKTPYLQTLDLTSCTYLNSDALKHLVHTPDLKGLNICMARQLEKNALQHLKHTPHLRSLDISGIDQLEKEDLKHLPPGLISLGMAYLPQLDNDTLEHLPLELQILNLYGSAVPKLHSLKNFLKKRPQLQTLGIKSRKKRHKILTSLGFSLTGEALYERSRDRDPRDCYLTGVRHGLVESVED